MRQVLAAVAIAVGLSGTAYGQRADVLELRGPGSQIGVMVAESDHGVTIQEVRPGTPAEKAGFKAGDVVVSFDGENIRSARQLTRVVQETRPGKPVDAVVARDGARQTLKVTPETGRADTSPFFGNLRRPSPEILWDAQRRPPPDTLWDVPRRLPPEIWDIQRGLPNRQFYNGRSGLELTRLTDQLATYFGVQGGALVSRVDADSPASRAGLKSGDVITAIDGLTVDNPIDVTNRLSRTRQGSSVEMKVTRDKKALTLKGTF